MEWPGGRNTNAAQLSLMASDRVRQDATLQESCLKAVERRGSSNITRRMVRQCSSIELDGITQFSKDAMLLESVVNVEGNVVKRAGLTRISGGTVPQRSPTTSSTSDRTPCCL